MKTTSITIRYRRKASGVQTTLRNVFGTGEGPLGYELLSGTCLVQERGLWGTNRTRNVFGTGDGSLVIGNFEFPNFRKVNSPI